MRREKQVFVWISPSERVKTDLLTREIDFGPDQPTTPVGAHIEFLFENRGSAGKVCDADEDHHSLQSALHIELPVRRERPPRWSLFDTHGVPIPMRRDEAL